MTDQPSTFPSEIVALFLEPLARDVNALRACSLVCKNWHSMAQPLLFSNATVSGRLLDPGEHWLKNPAQYPHIASYVQQICLDGSVDLEIETQTEADALDALYSQAITELAAQIVNFQALKLESIYDWKSQYLELIQRFPLSTLKTLVIRSLWDFDADKFVKLIRISPLKTLKIMGLEHAVEFDKSLDVYEERDTRTSPSPVVRSLQTIWLARLEVWKLVPILRWLLNTSFDLGSAKDVLLAWKIYQEHPGEYVDAWQVVNRFLLAISQTVATLYLAVTDQGFHKDCDMIAGHLIKDGASMELPNLRKLFLEGSILSIKDDFATFPFAPLLPQIEAPELEELVVVLSRKIQYDWYKAEQFPPEWEELDSIVSSTSKFPKLQRVTIDLRTELPIRFFPPDEQPSFASKEEAIRSIEERLPKTLKEGRLSVRFNGRDRDYEQEK